MSRPSGNGAGPIPYRRGWRAPWRGEWGGFGDGHTRLSCLARRIEREELASFPACRLRQQVARLRALAVMVEESLGSDPKATVRRLTALVAIEGRQMARLEQLGGREPLDLARRLQAAGERSR